MNASQIFKKGHKVARSTRELFETYRAAFANALRGIYQELREMTTGKEAGKGVDELETKKRKCAWQKWLELMIREKGVALDDHIEIEGHFGVTWEMLTDFLGEAKEYQETIRHNLVHIDFKGGDIFHYLTRLATGMVKACR